MKEADFKFFDLPTLIGVVWRAKWLVAICSLGMSVAVYALTYLITPQYRVTTVVADASEPGGSAGMMSALGQLGSLASLAGFGLTSEVRSSDEGLAVLDSDEFLDRFISRHNVMPVLYQNQWDAKKQSWTSERGKEPTIGKAIRLFRTLITVGRDRRTLLISVSVEWKDRATAEMWCGRLIEDLNAEMQGRALQRAREDIDYLRKHIEIENNIETRQAVGRLLEAQLKQEMLASVSKDYVFKIVSHGRQPEADRFVRPRRMLMAAVGFLFGSGLGVLAAFVLFDRSRKRA